MLHDRNPGGFTTRGVTGGGAIVMAVYSTRRSHGGLHQPTVCILLTLLVLMNLLSTSEGTCTYSINSAHAAARYAVSGGPKPYFSYSCSPCVYKEYEVHVLSMYRPYSTDTVQVEIEVEQPTDIKLMLLSHEAAHWSIKKPANVDIIEIVLVSSKEASTVVVGGLPSTSTTKTTTNITGWKSAEMEDFVKARFGFLSSYTGVHEASIWTLTVGNCTKTASETTTTLATQKIRTTPVVHLKRPEVRNYDNTEMEPTRRPCSHEVRSKCDKPTAEQGGMIFGMLAFFLAIPAGLLLLVVLVAYVCHKCRN